VIDVTPTILVLGGSGFVGRYVVARLAAKGYRVTVLTRRRASARHLILLPTVDVVGRAIPTIRRRCCGSRCRQAAAINLTGILNEGGGRPSSARTSTCRGCWSRPASRRASSGCCT
jgi:NAD(P)-dependent dehydrogenase (short-subunit alcohol dehydrogenase family)